MPPTRPRSSPRAQSSRGRPAPPTPTVVRRMEVRHPLTDSDVGFNARRSREREQHCLDIANYIADLAGEAIERKYFDSVAADYTAASLWDSMMATVITSCQDHDRPAHPSDVYDGVAVKRPGNASSSSRFAVDASLPLAPTVRRSRSQPALGRHAQIALVGGSGGQGVDVVLEVVNSATNWSSTDSWKQVNNEPSSPDRGDLVGVAPATTGEGGRWRTDAAPSRIPCDEHSRYVAGIINTSVRAVTPGSPITPRRRAMTRIGLSVSQVVDAAMASTRLQVSTTPRVTSARGNGTESTGAVSRSASRGVAKSETPNTTPRPTSHYKRNRPETAKEVAERTRKEEAEAEAERLQREREEEENLPPDVDLDCHRQLTERLRKERVAKEMHDKRLQAVVAGMSVLQTSKQPFIVDGSKGLVVGIQSVGDTMQRALQNSPRFSVEKRLEDGADGGVQTPAAQTRPATSSAWGSRGATPRTSAKRKAKSAEDKLKEFVEPQTFKPMEILVEPAGGVTHVDGGGTVKKAEMKLPPGKLNQEEYAKLVARGSSSGVSSTGGWFADVDAKSRPEAASRVVPATPTLPHSSPRKPQSAQSARSFRR